MRQALLIVIPSLAAIASSGCVVGGATGAPYSESLRASYTNFDKVDVSAGVETVVGQGPFDVRAEILKGDNFDDLIVEVRGDTLHIGRKPHMMGWNGQHYRVNVNAPLFTSFEASSGSSIDGANLRLGDLSVDVSSGAEVSLSGACTTLRADLSSGASFSGENLHCESAEIDASSGAHADAFATRSANGDASSGASVTFLGNPASVSKDTSSGGSVTAR